MKKKTTLFSLFGMAMGMFPITASAQALTLNDGHTDCCEFHRQQTTKAVKAPHKVITAASATDIAPTEGKYVNILNLNYEHGLTEGISSGSLSFGAVQKGNFSQIWKFVSAGSGKWKLQNALTGNYVASMGGALSQHYSTNASGWAFNISDISATANLKDYTIFDTGSAYLHEQGDSRLVGWWDASAPASQWVFREVEVDEAAVTAARNELKEAQNFTKETNASLYRQTLNNYFEDSQYLTLKPAYQSKSDAELRELLSQPSTQNPNNRIALPDLFIDMILKVKNEAWAKWEKHFRVYDYKAYSDPNLWNGNGYAGTGYQLSPQTGPTGISVKKGHPVLIFVGANQPSGTSLEVMLCNGMSVTGPKKRLVKGYNAVIADEDAHVFICYTITDPKKKIANTPPINIHIEGGYVNGYFDITRGHTNADWHDMLANGLLTDPIVHLKNNYYEFNVHLNKVKEYTHEYEKNLVSSDGVPKSIAGMLMRWDTLVKQQRGLMGLDTEDVKTYFNSYLSASASSGGNPYASTYGTYYPGVNSWANYMNMTRGYEYDHGGDFWMVAHETGHIHQKAINIAGDTEMSVNFFSQVNRWLQGSNVGRGPAFSVPLEHFLSGKFYHELDLWSRSRMYFQLYLYYHVQQHDTLFYPKLFAALRQDPMSYPSSASNPGSGLVNYLKFAIKASEAAGEDLSEFFRYYGFFVPLKNYDVNDYSHSYFTTTQADIDRAIAEMGKYPKAHPGLFFIDERIRKIPVKNPEMTSGYRLATTPGATPGVSTEVGSLGMVYDYTKDLVTKSYRVNYLPTSGRVVLSQGKGAVGVKVYDENGKVVYLNNSLSFVLPETLRSKNFAVVVVYGNGEQEMVYKKGEFDFDKVTAISTVEADDTTQEEVRYDLSGRRTKSQDHGVYILNGRTVVK